MQESETPSDLPFSEGDTAPHSGRAPAPPGPERIGGYRVVRELGRGGMGVVYEAMQENPRRAVALKVIHPAHFSTDSVRRFEREAGLLGKFQHPGIAQIIEAGADRDWADLRPFFVMELVKGRPLTAYARDEKLDVPGRVRLMAEICDAVQHAHQKGVIHRDIKPGNVLVTDGGRPKVLDFGLARLAAEGEDDEQPMSLPGVVMGTFAYMSPEQASGDCDALDVRTDVYALGAVLSELLAGRPPIDLSGLNLSQRLEAIRKTDPPPLGRDDPRLRGDLEAIVGKCLEKEPPRRYGTAEALADDLRRYLDNQPVRARPASGLYRARKFVRRNRGAFLAASGLCVGLVAVAASLAWGQYQKALGDLREGDLRRKELSGDLYQGRAAMAQGDWRAAKASFDSALARAERFPLDPESRSLVFGSASFWLDGIAALDGLNDFDGARTRLAALRRRVDRGEVSPGEEELGEILIRRADLDPEAEPGSSAAPLIRWALRGGLRPEYEAYARGFLAPTAPEAVAHFGNAWRIDRYLGRARFNHALALIFLGEPERAREIVAAGEALSPGDPGMTLLHAVTLAMLGRREEAGAAAAVLRAAGWDREGRAASAAVETVLDLSRDEPTLTELDYLKALFGLSGGPELPTLPAAPEFIREYKESLRTGGPPEVRRWLGHADPGVTDTDRAAALVLAESVIPWGPITPFLIQLKVSGADWDAVERLSEGLLRRPHVHLASRDELNQILLVALRWRLSAHPLFPDDGKGLIRRCLMDGIKSHPDRELATRASRQLRACLDMRFIPNVYFVPMSQVWWFTGDVNTSRLFLLEGLRRYPDDEGIREGLEQVEAMIGSPEALVRAADRYELRDPADPIVARLREKARDRLAEIQKAIDTSGSGARRVPVEPAPAGQ